jgi:transcriptional regulator with XRE-family HTH domain
LKPKVICCLCQRFNVGAGEILSAVAINVNALPYRHMPLTKSAERAEQEVLGKAIRELRRRANVSQQVIAAALEMTTQGYGVHELGERRFTHDKLQRILSAIGATEQELAAERARILGQAEPQGVAERAQPFVLDVVGRSHAGGGAHRTVDIRQLLGPASGALEVAGEEMAPWAEPGETLFFDRDRYPKRGHGCIVETTDGAFVPRLYERSDGSTLRTASRACR